MDRRTSASLWLFSRGLMLFAVSLTAGAAMYVLDRFNAGGDVCIVASWRAPVWLLITGAAMLASVLATTSALMLMKSADSRAVRMT